jgi:hypothetical protein
MLHRRLRDAKRSVGTGALACPSYEDMRIQSAILGFVVGEGHNDLTIFELACRYSHANNGDRVERAVRDLVGSGLLSIDAGKVVPGLVTPPDVETR